MSVRGAEGGVVVCASNINILANIARGMGEGGVCEGGEEGGVGGVCGGGGRGRLRGLWGLWRSMRISPLDT